MRLLRVALLAAGVPVLVLASACEREPAPLWNLAPAVGAVRRAALPATVNAIWVARFHYRSADDIDAIMRNARAAGCNTVLFQVRGTASVAYPSQLEPWAEEFGDRDPGFDPLGTAVNAAQREGLRLEAWINVLPAWRGVKPPRNQAHLYHTRPEWFLYDETGRRQALNEHYVILNPCRADVRSHIVAVAEEIISRYAVAGLHLDYVRYAWEQTPGAAQRYPGDAETRALYERQTGLRPGDDLAAWSSWRAAQLTRLVAELRAMLARRRPDATLTAATWGNPGRGSTEYLQDATGWLASGLLDAAYPMVYRTQLADLLGDLAEYDRAAPGKRVIPGLGAYLHQNPEQSRSQLAACSYRGGDWAIFSYETLFEIWNERGPPRADVAARRRWLREMLTERSPEHVEGRAVP